MFQKEKTEKMNELKRLATDRAKVEADIAKIAEQLAATLAYRTFLVALLPSDFRATLEQWQRTEGAGLGRGAPSVGHHALDHDADDDAEDDVN